MEKAGFMRTTVLLLAAALLAPAWARATTGTCTITSMAQTNPYPLGIDFAMPLANGFAIPVEFDETAGTFTMDHEAWRTQFPDLGAAFLTIGGVHGFLQFDPGATTGTIDASGTIALPGFGVTNSTDYVDPPPVLPVVNHDVSTGAVIKSVSVVSRAVLGVPLDFTTGKLVLVGLGFIQSAPGSAGTNMAGMRIGCTLSPIPDRNQLPPGASITKVKGKAKLDKKTFENGSKADQLTLKATLTPGPAPLVLDGTQPLGFGVSVGGAERVGLFVAGGKFQKKGKKLIVTRDDTCKIKKGATSGTCRNDGATTCETFGDCASTPSLQVLSGRKSAGEAQSQLGGSIVLVAGKGGTAVLTLKVQGLDLGSVSGATDVTVALGAVSAGTQVQTSNGKIK
jgi:hypothetical protein